MNIVILGSGRGSNARALLLEYSRGKLGKANPVAIVSDKEEAGILKLGDEFNVPSVYLNPGKFKTKLEEEAEQRYIAFIEAQEPDLVVLAGFMRVIKKPFLDAFAGKIINLHPSLLPSFKGLDGIKQAWDYGVKVTGCTVHYVTADLDGGPIIDQEAVRIEPEDTLESLSEKVHAAEHRLLPKVVKALAEG